MRRFVVILPVLLALGFAASAAAGAHHRYPHHPECNRPACARNADREYARRHRPKFTISSFDLCVANAETGEPGSTDVRFIRPSLVQDGGRLRGAYSMEDSKWTAAGGRRFAAHADEASYRDQTRVFEQAGRRGEWTLSNWPTIAQC